MERFGGIDINPMLATEAILDKGHQTTFVRFVNGFVCQAENFQLRLQKHVSITFVEIVRNQELPDRVRRCHLLDSIRQFLGSHNLYESYSNILQSQLEVFSLTYETIGEPHKKSFDGPYPKSPQ